MTTIQRPQSAPNPLPQPLRVVRVVPVAAPEAGDVRVELSRPLTDLERRALELVAARTRRPDPLP